MPPLRLREQRSGLRHSFYANTIYELPLGHGRKYFNKGGLAQSVLGGWELSLIATARTGIPVNVTVDRSASAVPDGNTQTQRPDLISGMPFIPTGGATVADWINPAAFAFRSMALLAMPGRNLVRGPGIWQADTSLGRKFAIRERASVEFLASAFNLFNRAQFGLPAADIRAPLLAASRLRSTAASPAAARRGSSSSCFACHIELGGSFRTVR